jgi:hypothetical protein
MSEEKPTMSLPPDGFIPVPTGQVISITRENAQEFADIIGQPLADYLSERKDVLLNQYVQIVPPERPEVPLIVRKCVVCGKDSSHNPAVFTIGYKTSDGFRIHRPTCWHAEYLTCQQCEDAIRYGKCPVCGCTEEYC